MSSLKKRIGGKFEGPNVFGTMINIGKIKRQQSMRKELKRQFGVDVYPHFGTPKAHNIYSKYKAEIEKLDSIIKELEENARNRQGVLEVKEDPQFGVTPISLQCTSVEGYKSKIPNVLLQLKYVLAQNHGLRTTGIFRIAPDKEERDIVKVKINKGVSVLEATGNVHVAASLIGVWFRDLPTPILDEIGQEKVKTSQSVDKVVKAHESLSEPQHSIIIWLWDLLVEVTEHSEFNKMDIRNLAIIFAPSMFDHMKFQNPMLAMDYSRSMVSFCAKAMEWRKEDRKVNSIETRGVRKVL